MLWEATGRKAGVWAFNQGFNEDSFMANKGKQKAASKNVTT